MKQNDITFARLLQTGGSSPCITWLFWDITLKSRVFLGVTHAQQAKSLGKPWCLCGELHKAVKHSLLLKYLEKSTSEFQSAGAALRSWGGDGSQEEQIDLPQSSFPHHLLPNSWCPTHLVQGETAWPPTLPSFLLSFCEKYLHRGPQVQRGQSWKRRPGHCLHLKKLGENQTTHKSNVVGKVN